MQHQPERDEGEPEVLQLWTRMLHIYDRSLRVTTVGDGRRALELMDRVTPDVVVLDVMMPGMDGWEVLARMAEKSGTQKIPAIVVSAQDPQMHVPSAPFLIATCGRGFSATKLLRCSLSLSSTLLNVDQELEPMHP